MACSILVHELESLHIQVADELPLALRKGKQCFLSGVICPTAPDHSLHCRAELRVRAAVHSGL